MDVGFQRIVCLKEIDIYFKNMTECSKRTTLREIVQQLPRRVSHSCPVQSGGHSHLYPGVSTTHVAVLAQGLDPQSSITVQNK